MNQFLSLLVALVGSLMNGMSLRKNSGKDNSTMPLVPKTPTAALFLDQEIQFIGAACLFFLLETNN